MTNILTQPKFSIAMVNYKTLELTKIALELLKKHFGQIMVYSFLV